MKKLLIVTAIILMAATNAIAAGEKCNMDSDCSYPDRCYNPNYNEGVCIPTE